ncbi:hypothetical protein [Spirosoma gilvum]
MITFDDLGDRIGILKVIQELAQANQTYGDTVEATNNRIKKSLESLITTLFTYQRIAQTDPKQAVGIKDDINAVTTAYRNQNTVLGQNSRVIDANNAVIDQMQKRLSGLQKEYDSLDLAQKKDLQRKKEIEREVTQTTRALNGLVTATNSSSRAIKAAEGSVDALRESTKDLYKQLNAMPDAYIKGTDRINQQNKAAVALNAQYQQSVTLLKKIESDQQVHNRHVGNYPKLSGALNIASDLTGLSGAASAAGIGAVIASAGAAVLEVGQEYEKLALLTENALNNNKKAAAEANAVIRDFADHSPHDIEGVTKAYTRLVDIGIIPTKEQLTEISDIAVAKNKTVMDYVEAIADAQQGDFARLTEFGINASKSGDKIIFTFKGVRTTVDDNSTAISNYLIGLSKVPGVIGATDKLAQSFSGRLSTMKDGVKGVASDLFQTFLPALNAVLGALNWGIGIVGGFVKGLKQMSQEQGILTTLLKFSTNPFGAVTEAWDARKRAPQTITPNSTPESDKLRKQLQEQQKVNDAKRKADEAAAKAAKEADKVLSETLGRKKAANDTELAQLEALKQDGLISEADFIKKRKQITLAGIAERQAILRKAGKTETDDYKRLATEKLEAETLYKRESLKLALAGSKADAAKAIAGLGRDKEDGTLTDSQYNEQKRGILVASLNEQKQLLIQAGQGQSQLAKEIDEQLLEADRDYFRERVKIAKAGWKKELTETVDDLKEIDQQTAEHYESELVKIQQFYDDQRAEVRKAQANGKLTSDDAQSRLATIDINQLQSEIKAYRAAYDEDRFLSDSLIEAKLQKLQEYKAKAIRTQAEIKAAEEQIAALKKAKEENAANDKKKLDKEVADNAIAQSKRKTDKEISDDEKAAKKKKELRDFGLALGQTLGDAYFQIEQQNTANRLTELDKQKQAELDAAGDSASAKSAIEAKYTQQRKVLMHQQDVQNRQRAIFDILIAAAVNAIKDPTTALFTGGLALAEIAAISAVPLPTYFTGKNFDGITNDNYSGPAVAGERGRELWQHDGKLELVDKPSLIKVGRNDVIYPNYMTEHMLQANAIVGQANRQSIAGYQLAQNQEAYQGRQLAGAINWDNFPINRLADAIGEANEKLPFNMTTFDERGVLNWFIKANQRTLDHSRKHDHNWTKVNGEWRRR